MYNMDVYLILIHTNYIKSFYFIYVMNHVHLYIPCIKSNICLINNQSLDISI